MGKAQNGKEAIYSPATTDQYKFGDGRAHQISKIMTTAGRTFSLSDRHSQRSTIFFFNSFLNRPIFPRHTSKRRIGRYPGDIYRVVPRTAHHPRASWPQVSFKHLHFVPFSAHCQVYILLRARFFFVRFTAHIHV